MTQLTKNFFRRHFDLKKYTGNFVKKISGSKFNVFGCTTLVSSSVVDPDPYWIRIQELSGFGSAHANIG